MGQQTSNLNCKINEADNKNQIFTTKQFAVIQKKSISNIINRNTKNIKQQQNKTENQTYKQKINNVIVKQKIKQHIITQNKINEQIKKTLSTKIPQHQCITKVLDFPFKGCIKLKKYFVQQKNKSLGDIIETRYNTTKHFPYSQIISLTQCLIYSLAYIAKKQFKFHDFYPTNIFYIDGKFKLINPLQINFSSFYLTSNRQRFSFLSPQLIIAILEQLKEQQIDGQILNKSDIFAIGMILLELCTLQPSSECYEEQTYNIIDSKIQERIAKVSKIYTPTMANLISQMLEYQVQKRIDPLNLAKIVHAKIQNQKKIAFQLENQNRGPIPQQNLNSSVKTISPNGGMSSFPMTPTIMPSRGPPPPPYSHQSFRMQNLNPNVIAVSIPNETFTRISPNNQGFLSSSSLQQKLRVIQLIKQNANEDDSQGQNEKRNQNKVTLKQNQIYTNNLGSQNTKVFNQRQIFVDSSKQMQIQNQKVKYPMVDSIYQHKKIQNQSLTQPNKIENNINLKMIQEQRKIVMQLPQLPQQILQKNIYQNRTNTNQIYSVKRNQINISPLNFNPNILNGKHINNQVQFNNFFTQNNNPNNFQNNPINHSIKYGTSTDQNNKISEINIKNNYPQQRNVQNIQNVSGFLNFSERNLKSPRSNINIVSTQSTNNLNKNINSNTNSFTNTNFNSESKEGQTLQQRVKRILNMSRNVK